MEEAQIIFAYVVVPLIPKSPEESGLPVTGPAILYSVTLHQLEAYSCPGCHIVGRVVYRQGPVDPRRPEKTRQSADNIASRVPLPLESCSSVCQVTLCPQSGGPVLRETMRS